MTNDIRTKSIAFLNAAKSALAYNSKPGFKELMKTFGLPPNPWIPGELEVLKVIEVIGEKASNAKQWRWVSKDAAEQIFDALVLSRRKTEPPVSISGLLGEKAVRTIVDDAVGPLVARLKHYSDITYLLARDIHGPGRLDDDAHLDRMGGYAKSGRFVVGDLDALKASREKERPPATELLEMAINDLDQLGRCIAVIEGNVMATMREVFKHLPSGVSVVPAAVAPPTLNSAKQPAKRKPLRVGVLGPWQRDWRYVIESVRHQDDVLVMIDRDVRPVRVVKGFDYVVIASDCTASAVEYRQAYGERAQVCPAGGMKRIAAFVDELIERHDKGAKAAA